MNQPKIKALAILLAILLAAMTALSVGMSIKLATWQEDMDETFSLAYGDLILALLNLYDSEQDTFTDSAKKWSDAIKAAEAMETVFEHTSYQRKNRKLVELVTVLTPPADRATGFRLRMTMELYQELRNLSDFTDEDAAEALALKVQAHTAYGTHDGTSDAK
jgi:hypothetical protein